MDTMTFLIGVVLLMIAVQYGQPWLVFGILAVLIVAMKSLKATILLILAVGIFYLVPSAELGIYKLAIIFVLVILALVLGIQKKSETYTPDYGSLFGGGGGGEY